MKSAVVRARRFIGIRRVGRTPARPAAAGERARRRKNTLRNEPTADRGPRAAYLAGGTSLRQRRSVPNRRAAGSKRTHGRAGRVGVAREPGGGRVGGEAGRDAGGYTLPPRPRGVRGARGP